MTAVGQTTTSAELSAEGVRVEFMTRSGKVARALDGADVVIRGGEVLALVGESGSGKTTLARTLVGLTTPVAGEVRWRGETLGRGARSLKALRRQVQLVLQDPLGALNPRHTVYDSVAEGLRIHKLVTKTGPSEAELVADALSSAGLRPPETLFLRYPHELSGGQRQRVLIAGALALQPQLLIADEPVSSLDASIRGEILALLLKLREELGLGVLVVTHDLGLAWNIADRIAVMYLGRVVESGPTEDVLTAPRHPYTRALLSVVPEMEGLEPVVLRGEIPDPTRIPSGCRFHPRCPALASGEADQVAAACRGTSLPVLSGDPEGHRCACHLVAAREALVSKAPTDEHHPTQEVDPMTLQAALPRELYVDPAAWAEERDRVLLHEWTCVGRLSDLGLHEPERVAVVEVQGESLLVTSDADGELHAAYNVCRHRGSQLFPIEPDDGSGAGPQLCGAKSIRCPYHSWTYALDGSLLRAPHTEEGEVNPAEFSLHVVGVQAWGGFVFVHLTPASAEPLAETVGRANRTLANYDLASLVTGLTFTYDVAANWKVIAENYNECYHCGPVHPELSRLVPSFAGGGRGLDWDAGIPHREGAWTFTMSGTTDRAPLPGLDDDERTRHKGELVYPNLMLSCSADHVAAFTLQSLAVDRTTIQCRLLFSADEAAQESFDPSDAGDLWDMVNRQDWAICESVQRGMSSRAYTHGWFAPMEDDSADIRRWLLPRLGTPHD